MFKTDNNMSNFGITTGWYKYPNETNNNGILVNVYHRTPQFVKVEVYHYYDNHYDINNIDEGNIHRGTLINKVKVDESKTIYPYQTKWVASWVLDNEHKISN